MKRVDVTPAMFDRLQRSLQQLEAHGYGPEACVVDACRIIGIAPPLPFEPLDIVVKDNADV